MKMKERKYAGETLDEAMTRTAAFDASVESLSGFVEAAEDFDGEYEVARLMENARKHAKLTQAQVAERMGTTQSSVARMLKSNLTLQTLARYLRACDARLKVAASYM